MKLEIVRTRIPHTVIRVGSIDHSIDFYTRVLGVALLGKSDYPDGQFTLVFVGYGNEMDSIMAELTYDWGVDAYEIGTGYDHVTIEVDDAYRACDDIYNGSGQVTREAGSMKHGTTVITFVTDPDDYKIELIQKSS